jgi:hypothetical protein
MTIEIIGLIAGFFGVLGLAASPDFLVVVFLISIQLGAAAAIQLDSLGGTAVSPSHLLLAFVVFRLFSDGEVRKNALRCSHFPRAGFWLLITFIYSIVTAFALPRLFAGMTYVFAVRNTTHSLVPLAPSTANFTQSGFFACDVLCFFALSGYVGAAVDGRKVLVQAALACAAINLGFAAIDLLTYWTNTTELLAFIRNTNYRMLNDTEVAGFKRIVGSFTEAASFGSVTLGYFAFCVTLWLRGFHTRISFILASLSLLALLFSTSATAYVGLSIFVLILYLQSLFKLLVGPVTKQTLVFLVIGPILASAAVIAIALNESSWSYVQNLFENMVLNKVDTESGIERAEWTRQAFQNFFDTGGFGAGNGSLRASSLIAAVAGSLGFLGAPLYGAFLLRIFFFSDWQSSASATYVSTTAAAARSTCLAWLITATIAGGFIDLGLLFFVFAALALSGREFAPFEVRSIATPNLASRGST